MVLPQKKHLPILDDLEGWPWPRIIKIIPESDSTALKFPKNLIIYDSITFFFLGWRPYWIFRHIWKCHGNELVNIFFHVLHVIINLLMYENITYQFDYQKPKNPPYPMVYKHSYPLSLTMKPWKQKNGHSEVPMADIDSKIKTHYFVYY